MEDGRRIFRKTDLAERSFGDRRHIARATEVATAQLNARVRPRIWGGTRAAH